MLVDLTDSTGCRLGKFMKGMSGEDDGARLLNAAISRARDHVILVANFEHLRAHAPDESIVIGLLDLFEEHGTALDLDNILPLGDEDWIDGLHKIITPNIELSDDQCGVFSEATFYPAFARDLETAERSVVLLSPFLTGRGVGRWANHFYAALQRGVHVRIVTRPSAEFGGASEEEVNETVDTLRELGVVVDLRGRMHEKVAIIDEMIAWQGSLNILSHRDTSECMLRLTGETACRHLIDLISPSIRKRDEERTPTDSETAQVSPAEFRSITATSRSFSPTMNSTGSSRYSTHNHDRPQPHPTAVSFWTTRPSAVLVMLRNNDVTTFISPSTWRNQFARYLATPFPDQRWRTRRSPSYGKAARIASCASWADTTAEGALGALLT